MKFWTTVKEYIYPTQYTCMICQKEAAADENNICGVCRAGLQHFDSSLQRKDISELTAAFIYDDTISKAVWEFKYNGKVYIADTFAKLMRFNKDWDIDFVTAVPQTKQRFKYRGYNQSSELAKRISDIYGLHFEDDVLIKIKETPVQVNLTASERRRNLHGAFMAAKSCKDCSVLLIDDVVTTASTVDECARMLKKAGAKNVFVMTLCIAGKSLTV